MRRLQRLYLKLFKKVFISSTSELYVKENVLAQDCRIRVSSGSRLVLQKGSRLINCTIELTDGSVLEIGENTVMQNMRIRVHQSRFVCGNGCRLSEGQIEITRKSELTLGDVCVIEQGDYWRGPIWRINDGSKVMISDHNRLRCNMEIRFSGECQIGRYNCINEDTEIRADERVVIGDYNMISYHCRIWDTDTHAFYEDDTRRRMTEQMFPVIGAEIDKPATKPVAIGSDNLIGERAAILKGSRIEDGCKIGFNVVAANKAIESHTTYVGK